MTAQALAGVLAGTTVVLLVAVVLLLRERAGHGAALERQAGRILDQANRDLDRQRERADRHARELDRDRAAARAELATERIRRESAETRLQILELDLARRREGPVREGELVALTTPQGATIRGTVRQTFDNGAVLLGAAVILDEVMARGGGVEVQERNAGDVAVPAHEWAQIIPPSAEE